MSQLTIYEKVNQLIVSELKEGVAPWNIPYSIKTPIFGSHKGIKSDRQYSGINAFVTYLVATKRGYESPTWATYQQWQEQGRQIKKSEKSIPILFFKKIEKENVKGEKEEYSLCRYYSAFNESQCEGSIIENKGYSGEILSAEKIIKNSPLQNMEVLHGRPAYSPSSDVMFMPNRNSFTSSENYYSTLFHESAHATGHESRLNRDCQKSIKNFGDHHYSKEELVAELTSAYLQAMTGISGEMKQSAAYCAGWLKAFENDPKIFVSAASLAQKATDYILGIEKSSE